MQEWFTELQQACARVEEVQKKNSGAGEIAIARRLCMLPRKKVVRVDLGLLTVKRDRSEEEAQEGRSVSAERAGDGGMPYLFSAVPVGEEDGGEDGSWGGGG